MRIRRTGAILLVLCAVLAALGVAAALMVLDRYGVGVHGNVLRLGGLVSAHYREGCSPVINPIACRVDGRSWRVQSSGADWGVSPTGPNALRFEMRAGDVWSKDVRQKHAVERVEVSDLARQPYGKDIWFGFDMLVEDGPKTTSEWVNLGQLHNTADMGEIGASPPWVQGFGPGDDFRIFIRHSTENPLKNNPPPVTVFEDKDFKRGRTYKFVHLLRLNAEGPGLLKVWRDGVLIVNYRGPISYIDKVGPYFKFGIYRSPAKETMVVRYSNMQFGQKPMAVGSSGGAAKVAP